MIKKTYLIFSILILVLGVASYFSFNVDAGNLVTGQAVGDNPPPPPSPPPSYLVGGDVDNCFVYSADCPSNSITMFRVGTEFFDSAGGAHIADVDNDVFEWRMCCKNILSYDRGNRKFSLFSTGYTQGGINPDIEQDYGSHVYPAGLAKDNSNFVELEPEIANYIEYSEGDCSPGYECIVKVSSLDKCQGYDFCNSHIWSCDRTFPNFNLTSVCYKPEQQTNCVAYEGECTIQGYKIIDGELVYCSFGEDDIQSPPDEHGACCYPGQYAKYNPVEEKYECTDTLDFICGFDNEGDDCYLPVNANPNTPPDDFMKQEYFDQLGCVIWGSQEACCWNVERYGSFGNYYCDFNILTI